MTDMKQHHRLWIVTSLFSPFKSRYRETNFFIFRDKCREAGVPLCVAELAPTKSDFFIEKDDADIVLHFEGESEVWQQVPLLNLAIEALPDTCSEVGVFEGDIFFLEKDWPQRIHNFLKKYPAGQAFKEYVHLPPDVFSLREDDPLVLKTRTFPEKSFGYLKVEFPALDSFPRIFGHPGFAWVFRRNVLNKYPLFELTPVGGHDNFVTGALYHGNLDPEVDEIFPEVILEAGSKWMSDLRKEIGESYGYCDLTLLHLYHGPLSGRGYGTRYHKEIWKLFNPESHLLKDENNLFAFTDREHPVARGIRQHFNHEILEAEPVKESVFRRIFNYFKSLLANIFTRKNKAKKRHVLTFLYQSLWEVNRDLLKSRNWYLVPDLNKRSLIHTILKKDIENGGGILYESGEEADKHSCVRVHFMSLVRLYSMLIFRNPISDKLLEKTDVLIMEFPVPVPLFPLIRIPKSDFEIKSLWIKARFFFSVLIVRKNNSEA